MAINNTVAIIQARMASTRLPGKILAELAGKPLLYHVVSRVKQAKTINKVIVATTDKANDDETGKCCKKIKVDCFRGSEDDVLDRFYQAAKYFSANVVVRLTADCPLLDSSIIDQVVNVFQKGNYDYVSNVIEPTYPDGLDTEVFSFETLERAWKEATLKSEREHVTPFIRKSSNLFRLANVKNDVDLSAMRWTVDKPADLEFVRRVYASFGSYTLFGMADIVALLHAHPEMQKINVAFERNEGYRRSLREDNIIKEETK
jgi:spore coat polysaccharide biosynthesis protein SpsF (cytidylyltransferase family)